MTTHRMSILGNAIPDASGNVWQEPYNLKATNDLWRFPNFIFADTATKDGLHGVFHVPMNYVGAAKFYVIWTAQQITNNVVWEMRYRDVAGDDVASLDQATAQETLTVTDAAPSATDRRLAPSMTATAGNFAAGDTVEFILSRDGSSGSDTMAGPASLVDIEFEWSDV